VTSSGPKGASGAVGCGRVIIRALSSDGSTVAVSIQLKESGDDDARVAKVKCPQSTPAAKDINGFARAILLRTDFLTTLLSPD